MFNFFTKKPLDIEIKYKKGYYYYYESQFQSLDNTGEFTSFYLAFIESCQIKKYPPENVLWYLTRYIEETFDNVNVITKVNNEPLCVVDGEYVFEYDDVYIVSISIQGPTVKKFSGLEYYCFIEQFELLMKLNIILYVTKDQNKAWENFPSYLELWRTMKTN